MDAVGGVIGRTRSELRAELNEELNIIRSRLNLPIVVNGRAERPRYRVPVRRGATW